MNNKNIIFTGIIFIILFIFFTNSVFAEKRIIIDPFETIDKMIEEFSLEIQNSGTGKGCTFKSGIQVPKYYNQKTTGVNAMTQDIIAQVFSSCYRKTVQRIDQDIQSKILNPFPKSGLACNDFSNIQVKIDNLIRERFNIFYKKFPQEIQKEYCLDDERSFSFSQTSEQWEELKKKIEDIKKRFDREELNQEEKSLKKNQEDERKKKRDKRIKEQAKTRVQSFVNEFIERSITAPLYAERSKISSNLKGLPNGKSRFIATKPIDIKDMFSPPKDSKTGKQKLSDSTKEKNTAEIKNILKNNRNKKEVTFSQSLDKKKELKDKFDTLIARFNKDLKQQEKTKDFTEAYSEAIINSLAPFHSTLQEAETFLNADEKALKTVLNRQNIAVTGN